MSNRIEATLSGVGTPDDVRASWEINLTAAEHPEHLLVLQRALEQPVNCSIQLARACLAMICASFNKSFITTGQLYQVDDTGHISYRYFATGKERDLILQLMS